MRNPVTVNQLAVATFVIELGRSLEYMVAETQEQLNLIRRLQLLVIIILNKILLILMVAQSGLLNQFFLSITIFLLTTGQNLV